MKVLVIGGGGREHALCWSLLHSPRVDKVLCAPGNAGIAGIAECLPVAQDNVPDMLRVVAETSPDLVVVGPEVPLAAGIVDALQARSIRVFGPTRAAAQLESSKAFAKDFFRRHNIPTARYLTVHTAEDAAAALPEFPLPVVLKADGLAAGKGVIIAETAAEADGAVDELLAVGGSVVIEEFLTGEELSFFALCDGTHAIAIAAAQDHKRLGEGDTGPNTGGMGAYSTDALLPDELKQWLLTHVAQPTVDGMRAEGMPFRGILFCGIMLVPGDDVCGCSPRVLEFNTRWGDPETQAILLRLETDLLDLLEASVDGTAGRLQVQLRPGASVCVVVASAGYPASPKTGAFIQGLQESALAQNLQIFHAGTSLSPDGSIVASGGRVLGITAAAPTLLEAADSAYSALGKISFPGMQFRRDIGWRALQREDKPLPSGK